MLNDKRTLITVAVAFVVLYLAAFGYFFVKSTISMESVADRDGYSLSEGTTLRLDKGWTVYTDDPKKDTEITEPGIFDTGEYYFRINLETSGMKGRNAFLVNPVYSAYTLEVNGKQIAQAGTPASDGEIIAGVRSRVVPFIQESDVLEIVIHVSNFSHRYGGSLMTWVSYGRYEDIVTRDQQGKALDILIAFVLFSFALLHFFNYFYQQKNPYSMYFFLLMFVYALYSLFTGRVLASHLFPMLGGRVIFRIEELLMVLTLPAALNYTHSLFPEEVNRKVILIARIATLAAALSIIFLPVGYERPLANIYTYVLMLGAGYLIWRLSAAVRNNREGAGLTLISFSIMAGCMINDYLCILGLFRSKRLIFAGIIIFALHQTYRLILDNIKDYRKNQEMHVKLSSLMNQKESFFARNSIELYKPIRNIVELSESLLKGSIGPLNSEQIATSSLIVSNGVRLSNMLNDILDFSRIKENTVELNPGPVDLFKLSRKVLNSCESLVALNKVEIGSEISREMKIVSADDRRVEQILYNILSNSIRHTDSGRIIISGEELEDKAEISVLVEGSNLDDKTIEALFAAYEQGISEGIDDKDVSDLSLAIAGKLIELHGSSIALESGEGRIVYRFCLPYWDGEAVLTEEEALEMDALINLQPVLDEITSDRNIEVLIAGRDVEELQILKSQLSSMNYSVVPMISGVDLLNRIKEDVPHLVVIDVKLPDMSGYSVCSEIRKVFSKDELPVILVINKEDVSDMMEGLTSGANDFLTRPYIQEEFLTRVNTHLQLSRISNIYSRFVPTEFLSSLGQQNITDVELGDQVSREMTILFVDIRSFTNLSENMTPEENFKFINSYLSRFSPMITSNGGFVDKFIGDAIMALFPDKPENALSAAREMIEHVNVYNGHRANCGYRPINIGVGIHTGNMILGIIGDEKRMQGTVISDAVNLASRIQDVTKLYKANVVISQETFVKLENPVDYNFRFLGRVRVKGKDKAVALFEIFDADTDEKRKKKNDTKGDFEEAIMKFSRRDLTEAKSLLEKVAIDDPDDQTTKVFLDRIEEMRRAEKKAFLTSL